MRPFLFVCLFFAAIAIGPLHAQEAQLAQQYFENGEYEKAAVLYDKLFEENNRNDFFFERYVDCLFFMEDYDRAEKAIRQELKRNPANSSLLVLYGNLYERQFREDEANQKYAEAIASLKKDRYQINKLAYAFIGLTKFDFAIQAYEKGAELLKDNEIFSFSLAELYRRKGDTPNMIRYYLLSLVQNPTREDQIKTIFQRFLQGSSDFEELQKQLYANIQVDGESVIYPDMLSWVFIQQKDYKNAFRQMRALDRRMQEDGQRIYRLGRIAANEGDFDAAIEAFQYVYQTKGPGSGYYVESKRLCMLSKREKIVGGFQYTREELETLELEYEQFLDEFGRSTATAAIMAELAELEAFYLDDLDQAVSLLSSVVALPGLDAQIQAEAKLDLGDFYLMKGDIWEATLLYSQVDKAYKEDLLGHEARFKNAKLSYYNSDFQWAQAQFDVLKASTSRLIANDALDLSVFIMDNLNLDTTVLAMKMYATAELLLFQNKFEEAFLQLDSLMASFPGHSLEDDVLYLKAEIYRKTNDYSSAAETYQRIVETYKESIRADNALFALAEIYEYHLKDVEAAKKYYETIFIDYSDSTFAVEARKKFRLLRGDNL
ncbi:MAG: tetratricopeptide repeat protein [Saprospiraceae bacterium]|jgi:tetratricopeptide (TPR) repeat protein|nr:tetratricopeptide repeat protein [Saprospiraceae bacterium]MDP4999536.1 tetratricopeptide repeat protein [Saprospiraceae bacterium]